MGWMLVAVGLMIISGCTSTGDRMTPAQLAQWQSDRSACNAIDAKILSRSMAIAKDPTLTDQQKAVESAKAIMQDPPEVQAADLAALAKCDQNRSATIVGALTNLEKARTPAAPTPPGSVDRSR